MCMLALKKKKKKKKTGRVSAATGLMVGMDSCKLETDQANTDAVAWVVVSMDAW